MEKRKNNSIWRELWRRLIHNKRAVFAMIILSILLLIVIFADVIVPYSKAVDQSIMERSCSAHSVAISSAVLSV